MPFSFLLTLAFLIRLLLIFTTNWHPDVGNHLDWGNKLWEYGPATFYQQSIWKVSWPNQPIGSIYLFALLAKSNQNIFNFFWYLNTHIPAFPSGLIPILENNLHVWLVKLPFIVSDIFIAILLWRIFPKNKLAVSLFLFNPAIIYNSAVWGQTDAIINLLTLVGIYLLFEEKYFWGIFLFLSSYLFKMSLLIYLPIFSWILVLRYRQWKKWLPPLIIFAVFTILLASPFSVGQNPANWLFHLYRDLVFNRQGHMLNGNAFNIWLIVYGVSLVTQDNLLVFGQPAFLWGSLLFFLVTTPIVLKFIRQPLTFKNITIVLFLIAYSAFLFLTNMHERYLYPIFPLLSLLYLYRFISLPSIVIISLVHLLNLYNLWFYPDIPWLKIALQSQNFILPRLLSFLLIAFYLKFYIKYLKSE